MTKFLIWGEKKGVNIQQGNTKYAKYELLGLLKATGCCLSNKIPFYGTVARVFLLIVLRDSISKWEVKNLTAFRINVLDWESMVKKGNFLRVTYSLPRLVQWASSDYYDYCMQAAHDHKKWSGNKRAKN